MVPPPGKAALKVASLAHQLCWLTAATGSSRVMAMNPDSNGGFSTQNRAKNAFKILTLSLRMFGLLVVKRLL